MSILYIRNANDRHIYALEESYSSLIWTERYQEAGDFVLEIPLNAANVDRYKPGNYLSLDDSRESMIIESREIDDTTDEPLLKVKGRSLSSLLSRRANISRVTDLQGTSEEDNTVITYNGDADSVLTSIFDDDVLKPIFREWAFFHRADGKMIGAPVEEGGDATLVEGFLTPIFKPQWVKYNVIKPAVRDASFREMHNIVFKNSVPSSVTINSSFSKIMTVYDLLVELCKQNYIGFRSYFNSSDEIVIETYQGANRSTKQNNLAPVIFNPIMENVTRLNYLEDYSGYKTTGFVYTDSYINMYPKTEIAVILNGFSWVANNGAYDFDRRCVPLDARSECSFSSLRDNPDLDSVSDFVNEGEISGEVDAKTEWAAYYSALAQKLQSTGEALYEEGNYKIIRISEGEVDPLVRYTFGEDYDIGDTVEISDERGNLVMSAYIDEAVRSYDTDGVIVTPNFKNVLDYDDGGEEE